MDINSFVQVRFSHCLMNCFFSTDKEAKKRQKKVGIGGFVVRLRGPRYKDEDDGLDALESGSGDKPKRKAQRRKVIKNKLVENFPVYLQVSARLSFVAFDYQV